MELKEKLKAYSKVSPSGCWEWQRSRAGKGYGQISVGNQKQDYAHRVSYSLYHGPIPEGYVVRHKCDNPCCCNPDHLEVGSQKDNMQDCKERGRMSYPPVKTGKENNKTKLSDADLHIIRTSDLPLNQLAEMFNVTTQAIRWRKKQWLDMQEKG